MAKEKKAAQVKNEKKLKKKASIEDTIKTILGTSITDKKILMNKGEFIFSGCDQEFPAEGYITTMGYNGIKVSGTIESGAVIIFFSMLAQTKIRPLMPASGEKEINFKIPFPDKENGWIKFRIEKVSKAQKTECRANISFELLNSREEEMDQSPQFLINR
jgi:hypothetical protein